MNNNGKNPGWSDVFNTSHKIWGHIDTAGEAARLAGYKYFSWSGWVLDLNGSRVCLLDDVSARIVRPVTGGVSKKDLEHGAVNYCSWDRMKGHLSQAAGGRSVLGVRVDDNGFEIVLA